MIGALLTRLITIVFGVILPAYKSFKSIKSGNVKEPVRWMMYWIVFAFYTVVETFTDLFLCWFPFYYELKLICLFWLLTPGSNTSSFFYRKIVHPNLERHEKEIDGALDHVTEKSLAVAQECMSRGVNVAVTAVLKGQEVLVDQLAKRSQSLSNISYNRSSLTIEDISHLDQQSQEKYSDKWKTSLNKRSNSEEKKSTAPILRQSRSPQSSSRNSHPMACHTKLIPSSGSFSSYSSLDKKPPLIPGSSNYRSSTAIKLKNSFEEKLGLK